MGVLQRSSITTTSGLSHTTSSRCINSATDMSPPPSLSSDENMALTWDGKESEQQGEGQNWQHAGKDLGRSERQVIVKLQQAGHAHCELGQVHRAGACKRIGSVCRCVPPYHATVFVSLHTYTPSLSRRANNSSIPYWRLMRTFFTVSHASLSL